MVPKKEKAPPKRGRCQPPRHPKQLHVGLRAADGVLG